MTDHSRAIQELTAEYDALKKRIHELEAMEVDRKQDEESLRRSKEKYRLLYSSMRDGFVYLDMDGTFMECNPAFEEMIGYKLQELKNLTFTDITPEKWQAYDEEAVRRLRQTGDSEAGQKEFRRKNGVIFPVEIRATLLRDDDGKPSGFGAIVRDITERMQAEVALRKSEERYRLIAENTADTIAIFDLNLKPTYISHSILNRRGMKF
jgi:PAS domain S-box-containing protein